MGLLLGHSQIQRGVRLPGVSDFEKGLNVDLQNPSTLAYLISCQMPNEVASEDSLWD